MALVLVAITVTSSICWARPDYALYLLLVVVFWFDYLTEEAALLPRAAAFATEAIILLLTARALLERRGLGMVRLGIEWPLALLIGAGITTAIANGVSGWQILLGLRAMFRFVVLAYALVNLNFKLNIWRRTLQVLLFLMALQIPVALFQWLVLGKTDDQVFGSVRSTGVLAVLIIMTLCVLLARFLRERARLSYLILALGFFILPVIGEAKGFFFFLPLAMVVLLSRNLMRNPRRAVLAVAVVAVPAVVGLVYYGAVSGNADLLSLVRDGNWSTFLREPRVAGVWETQPADVAVSASLAPRRRALAEAWTAVTSSGPALFFGFGIGSRTFTREEYLAGPAGGVYIAPLATRLYELGLGGLLLYWGLFAAVLVWVSPVRKVPQPFWRALRFALPAITVLYVASDIYTDALFDPLACTFWVLASMVAARMHVLGLERFTGVRSTGKLT